MRIGVNIGPTGDWPEDIADKLSAWEQLGVERTFLTFWHPFDTLPRAVDLMS